MRARKGAWWMNERGWKYLAAERRDLVQMNSECVLDYAGGLALGADAAYAQMQNVFNDMTEQQSCILSGLE